MKDRWERESFMVRKREAFGMPSLEFVGMWDQKQLTRNRHLIWLTGKHIWLYLVDSELEGCGVGDREESWQSLIKSWLFWTNCCKCCRLTYWASYVGQSLLSYIVWLLSICSFSLSVYIKERLTCQWRWRTVLLSMVATNLMWLFSIWNVANLKWDAF